MPGPKPLFCHPLIAQGAQIGSLMAAVPRRRERDDGRHHA
jgi:hypothetical protein